MHLSSSEIALAASAITAASGWLIASRASHLNSKRDHSARLWEREAKVYEYMLSRVEYWAELRRDAMFAISRNETNISAPDPVEFEEDHRVLKARLDLFGNQMVHNTFDQASRNGAEFIGAFSRHRACKLNDSASEHEIQEAREYLILADKRAVDSQKELVIAAREAINQLPKLERNRHWRRLPPWFNSNRNHKYRTNNSFLE